MRNSIIMLLLFFYTASLAFSQDILMTKSKGELKVKVLEVSQTELRYKKLDNMEGPVFILPMTDITAIQYENGVRQVFNEAQTNVVQDNFGTVYFIRSTGFQGSAVAITAFVDGNFVCKLNNKKYSVHKVMPGERIFSVQFAGKSAKESAEQIRINIEAGKSYYIQMILQTGLFVNNLYCQEVTENSAKMAMANCLEDTKCF